MLSLVKRWWLARVRYVAIGNLYLRFTPSFGLGMPLGSGRRLRFARHHGLQLVVWRGERWLVGRQLFGHSTVKGERHIPPTAVSSSTSSN